MKLDSPWITRLAGLGGATFIRSWMGTLDYQAALYDRTIDPASPQCVGQKIYLFWHEYILFPICLRGHCNLAMLLSRHRDADILSRVAYHLGFEFVRGSTRRGGVAALRQLLARSRYMHLTITPDGPRGPRRQLAPGAVFLASRLGLPLVLMGFGFHRPWRVNSWDRFAVPRPFSRARAITSPQIYIPPDLDRQGIEYFRQKVELVLNRLTDEAEAWAAAGTRKLGQRSAEPCTAPPAPHRIGSKRTSSNNSVGPPTNLRSAREEGLGVRATTGKASSSVNQPSP